MPLDENEKLTMKNFLAAILFCAIAGGTFAQQPNPDAQLIAKRNALEKELESVAIIDRKLMIAMQDGKRMAADVYRPKDTTKKYPIIFIRTPYNFNYWDVKLGAPRNMTVELDAVKRGYAYVEMNERGHFFSEGEYDILGAPLSDGDDELTWMSSQPWSNGKVGTIGCSSTAEWQLGVAALKNKALAAMIPQGFGAGVGRVGPYYEQGNWYRGGTVQMLFIAWLYGEQNQVRPMFPANTTQEDLIRASKAFDLAQPTASYRLGESTDSPPGERHYQGGGWSAWNLCGPGRSVHGRRYDQAPTERSGVVSRGIVG